MLRIVLDTNEILRCLSTKSNYSFVLDYLIEGYYSPHRSQRGGMRAAFAKQFESGMPNVNRTQLADGSTGR